MKTAKKKVSKSAPMKSYEVRVERTSIILSEYTTTVKARGPHYARKTALAEAECDIIEWSETGNEKETFRVTNVSEVSKEQSKEDVEIYKHLTRTELLDSIVDKIMSEWDGKYTDHAIRNGYKGYADCTDAELIEAYKSFCEEE